MQYQKPIVSYYKSGDPTQKFDWVSKLTEINIIRTKVLSDEFIKVCISNKNKIYLHVVITGMGKTQFEPNIPSVKETFIQIDKLIKSGFPKNQILWIVEPILQNDNGLKSLELLLRVFTEFKGVRFRQVRFNLLRYKQIDSSERGKVDGKYSISGTTQGKDKFVISNDNILKRPQIKGLMMYLCKSGTFFKDYYKLIDRYRNIISVDNCEEALIGIRELMALGYKNEWFDSENKRYKIIEYEKNNKFKPIVNIISNAKPVRCHNRCLLCNYMY